MFKRGSCRRHEHRAFHYSFCKGGNSKNQLLTLKYGDITMAERDTSWTVITGSTGGIGSEIARILATRGDHLVLVNRSPEKAEHQRSELLTNHPAVRIELFTADFMDTDQIAQATDQIRALPGRIDTLYNTAGVLTTKKILSAQGHESHFAVNVLASYLMIKGLRPKLARPTNARPAVVVNFSSSAIKQKKVLELGKLANPDEVTGLMGTYATSKLAATTMSVALAEALAVDNILIRAIDPGPTKTPMTTGNAAMPKPLQWLAPFLFSPAEQQAKKVIDSAEPSAFESRSGILIANGREKKLPQPANDTKAQENLISLLELC